MFATTRATQVATAVTPSQPICGTGRGKSGTETIRCSQSNALRKASAMLVVNAMTGLLSRLASTVSRKSVRLLCRSVCTAARQLQGVGALGHRPHHDPEQDEPQHDRPAGDATAAAPRCLGGRVDRSLAPETGRRLGASVGHGAVSPRPQPPGGSRRHRRSRRSLPLSTTRSGCSEASAARAASRMIVVELIAGPSVESSGRGSRITHLGSARASGGRRR